MVTQPGLLEQAQEIGVGVLRDDDEVGLQGDQALEVGPREADRGGRDPAGHVRHVGVVGPAGHGHEPVRWQHLDEQLVGGQVERGHAPRLLGRGHRNRREQSGGERAMPQGRPPRDTRSPPRTERPRAG